MDPASAISGPDGRIICERCFHVGDSNALTSARFTSREEDRETTRTASTARVSPIIESPLDVAKRDEQRQNPCPFCGELILAVAKKCRFCGEWLDREERLQRLIVPIKEVPVWNIPFFVLLTFHVYWVFWFHRVFKELHARKLTEISPGKAVGLLFVPFYNFYWLFVAFAKLQTAIRRAYDAQHLPPPPTGWIWVMPAFWIPGSILNAVTQGASIPLTVTAASITLCYVQSWMNRLARLEKASVPASI